MRTRIKPVGNLGDIESATIFCDGFRCGRKVELDLPNLLKKFGPERPLAELMDLYYCRGCGARWPVIGLTYKFRAG